MSASMSLCRSGSSYRYFISASIGPALPRGRSREVFELSREYFLNQVQQLSKYNAMMRRNMLEHTKHTSNTVGTCRTPEHTFKFDKFSSNFSEITELHVGSHIGFHRFGHRLPVSRDRSREVFELSSEKLFESGPAAFKIQYHTVFEHARTPQAHRQHRRDVPNA